MVNSIRFNFLGTKINRQFYISNEKIKQTMERLSTGLRINRASDDAAGLAISERLKAQGRGLLQTKNNLNDGISMVKTAQKGLQSIIDILQRVRELTVQGKNGTLSEQDKISIDIEIRELLSHIDKIANNTTFNGINLLNHSKTSNSALGETWTPLTEIPSLKYLDSAVSNGSGTFVAINLGKVLYSTDGLTWSNVSGSPSSLSWKVIWTGTKFVAPGDEGIFTSVDGLNWEKTSSFSDIDEISYNGSVFVGMSLYGKIYTSTDLVNWTQQTNPLGTPNMINVSFDKNFEGGKFTILVPSQYKYLKSSDGVNWESGSFSELFYYYYGDLGLPSIPDEITEVNGQFFAALGTHGIFASDDGVNWTKYTNIPAGDYQEIEYDSVNNRLVAITDNGFVTISDGGTDDKLNIHSGFEHDNTFGVELSDVRTSTLGLDSFSVSDPNALQKIDTVLQKVTDEMTKFGIIENRLKVKLENNVISHISAEQTRQRIIDAQIVLETSTLIKEQLKYETAMAMLQKSFDHLEGKLLLLRS